MEKNSTHPPSQDLGNMTLRFTWEQNTNYNGSSFDADVRPCSHSPKVNANVTSLMGIVHTESQQTSGGKIAFWQCEQTNDTVFGTVMDVIL